MPALHDSIEEFVLLWFTLLWGTQMQSCIQESIEHLWLLLLSLPELHAHCANANCAESPVMLFEANGMKRSTMTLVWEMKTEPHLIYMTTCVSPCLRSMWHRHCKALHLIGPRGETPPCRKTTLPAEFRALVALTCPFSSGIDWAEGRGLPTWKVVSSMARDTLHFLTTLWKKICFFLSVFNQTDATFHTFLLGTTPSRGNREMY